MMVTPSTGREMQATDTPSRCVLLVEGNPLNMKLFSAMLTAEGYRVLEATDGPDALHLAHARHPDLVVMDVDLPGMSGLDAAQALKADSETCGIPIVITGERGLHSDDAAVRASGCDGFMAKPIGICEFLEIVETTMIRSLGGRPYVA